MIVNIFKINFDLLFTIPPTSISITHHFKICDIIDVVE